ncbi:MAG: hypothetical protein JSU65_13470 [Candidatus Zixiibacteriota bacterium]|nr:MAG: hypothetical protein JSU65_13470 [candidate division Zixibacteria bacterium]
MRDGSRRMATALAMLAILAMVFGLTAGVPQEAAADGTAPIDTFVVPPGGGGMPGLAGGQTTVAVGDNEIGDATITTETTLDNATIVKIMFAFAFVIR